MNKEREQELKRMARLAEEYDEILENTAFVGITDGEIHVRGNYFIKTFDEAQHFDRDCKDYPHKLKAYHNGAVYFAIFTEERFNEIDNREMMHMSHFKITIGWEESHHGEIVLKAKDKEEAEQMANEHYYKMKNLIRKKHAENTFVSMAYDGILDVEETNKDADL